MNDIKRERKLLLVAETIDALRIFPRFFLTVYLGWAFWITDKMVFWFMHLPADQRTKTVTTFVGIVTTGVYGLFVWIYKIYSDTGRDWTAPKAAPVIGNSAVTNVSAVAAVPASAIPTVNAVDDHHSQG